MNRTTQQHIEKKVEYLNRRLGRPEAPYTKHATGAYTANIGNFHLENVNGYTNLLEIVSESGGVHAWAAGTKQQIAEFIAAFMYGYEEGLKKGQS